MTNALIWLRALLWVRYPRPSDYYGFCKLLPLSGDLLINGVQYFLTYMFGNLRDLRIWGEQLTLIMAGKIFLCGDDRYIDPHRSRPCCM